MALGDAGAARKRGRPRNEGIAEAAMDAALDLLVTGGARAVTMDAVARRSGTTRAAIYRRWATAEELLWTAMNRVLLVAANRTRMGPPYSTDGMDLDAAVRQTMRRLAEIFGTPRYAASYLAMVTAVRMDPVLQPGLDRYQGQFASHLVIILEPLARSSGLPARLIADLIASAVMVNALVDAAPPSNDRIEVLAEIILRGCRSFAKPPAD